MSRQPKSNNGKNKIDESINKLGLKDIIMPNDNETYFDYIYSSDYNFINHNVYTFGSNEMGQLGYKIDCKENNLIFSASPYTINQLSCKNILAMSAGDGHSVCVSKSGLVYAWGASACGQLGLDGDEKMPRDSEGYPYQPIPIPVRMISDIKVKDVACGDAHTLALTIDGKLFSWGGAGCGQLGHPNINNMSRDADNCPYQPQPRFIDALRHQFMINIACGKAHSLAIDLEGGLYTWGAGACGQLGVEDITQLPSDDDGYPYQPTPKVVRSLKDKNIVTGVCGDVHTLVLTNKGEVYSFGGCSFGQLGLGPINTMPLDSDKYPYMPVPKLMETFSNIEVVSIACGDSHSMAIDSEGRLYAWGAAAYGQLGLESLTTLPKDLDNNPYEPEPSLVTFFKHQKVLSVACGEAHTLVLVEGGLLYSFGSGTSGQLGYTEFKENSSKIAKSLNRSVLLKTSESNF
jgi:alpha-tubulin suppressor-like RCC1 family protein